MGPLQRNTDMTKQILVVEDEPHTRLMLESRIKRAGFQVDLVPNGLEGVETYLASLDQGDPYALVLLDIIMPKMDGHLRLY